MGLKVYKPGQGYYTRMASFVGGAVLGVGLAAWLWDQLDRITWDKMIYLQGGMALLVISVLGWLLYRWIAVRPRSCDFLIATEGEMKKVNWPSRREVGGSTWVVICCVIMMAGLLFVADMGFAWFFEKIGVMDIAP